MTQGHTSEGPDAYCVRNNGIGGLLALALALLGLIFSLIGHLEGGMLTIMGLAFWGLTAGWMQITFFGGQRMVQGTASPQTFVQAGLLMRYNIPAVAIVVALTVLRLLLYATLRV